MFHGNPSIHMPREYARIFLKVVKVRVERLQDISNSDIEAEGFITKCGPLTSCPTCNRNRYFEYWYQLYAKRKGGIYAWDSNPWVWVYEFERIDKQEEL